MAPTEIGGSGAIDALFGERRGISTTTTSGVSNRSIKGEKNRYRLWALNGGREV